MVQAAGFRKRSRERQVKSWRQLPPKSVSQKLPRRCTLHPIDQNLSFIATLSCKEQTRTFRFCYSEKPCAQAKSYHYERRQWNRTVAVDGKCAFTCKLLSLTRVFLSQCFFHRLQTLALNIVHKFYLEATLINSLT